MSIAWGGGMVEKKQQLKNVEGREYIHIYTDGSGGLIDAVACRAIRTLYKRIEKAIKDSGQRPTMARLAGLLGDPVGRVTRVRKKLRRSAK